MNPAIDDPFRYYSCARKRGYASRERAQEFKHDAAMEPYLCQFCNLWHLGHPAEFTTRKAWNNRAKQSVVKPAKPISHFKIGDALPKV